jgi:hypothetical protein
LVLAGKSLGATLVQAIINLALFGMARPACLESGVLLAVVIDSLLGIGLEHLQLGDLILEEAEGNKEGLLVFGNRDSIEWNVFTGHRHVGRVIGRRDETGGTYLVLTGEDGSAIFVNTRNQFRDIREVGEEE